MANSFTSQLFRCVIYIHNMFLQPQHSTSKSTITIVVLIEKQFTCRSSFIRHQFQCTSNPFLRKLHLCASFPRLLLPTLRIRIELCQKPTNSPIHISISICKPTSTIRSYKPASQPRTNLLPVQVGFQSRSHNASDIWPNSAQVIHGMRGTISSVNLRQ